MNTTTFVAMALVGGGMAMVAVGILSRVYAREEQLAEILDLPWGEQDIENLQQVTQQHSTLVENTVGLTTKLVESVDAKGALLARLEKARVPVRPGEFALMVTAASLVSGVFVAGFTSNWLFGFGTVVVLPFLAKAYLNRRIKNRTRQFEEAFPDALTLIASSLSAGHTFLRSIQMMSQEAEGPIAEEFGRVVNETELGDSLIAALDRMATRIDVSDVEWVVQAIKIQQEVGGKLADLLHTLAEFIRAREEIRREIRVLTAEGRLSGWVLGGLPLFMLIALQVLNPRYLEPMYRGWGPVWLGVAGLLTAAGIAMIRKLVNSVEV